MIYSKLQARGIADIFRFVNERCRFLSALTLLPQRYAKNIADDDRIDVCIIAQELNHGKLSMVNIHIFIPSSPSKINSKTFSNQQIFFIPIAQ